MKTRRWNFILMSCQCFSSGWATRGSQGLSPPCSSQYGQNQRENMVVGKGRKWRARYCWTVFFLRFSSSERMCNGVLAHWFMDKQGRDLTSINLGFGDTGAKFCHWPPLGSSSGSIPQFMQQQVWGARQPPPTNPDHRCAIMLRLKCGEVLQQVGFCGLLWSELIAVLVMKNEPPIRSTDCSISSGKDKTGQSWKLRSPFINESHVQGSWDRLLCSREICVPSLRWLKTIYGGPAPTIIQEFVDTRESKMTDTSVLGLIWNLCCEIIC